MANKIVANKIMATQNTKTFVQKLKEHAGVNSVARWDALSRAVPIENLIPPTVSFESQGYALVVGSERALIAFASQIPPLDRAYVVFLCLENEKSKNTASSDIALFYASDIEIEGFLGAFNVNIFCDGHMQSLSKIALSRTHFDLVIDLTKNGIHDAQLPPFGFYAIGRALATQAQALEALHEMKGTFDKPKYFRLDPARCAHTSRHLEGCTRCIDACPADALNVIDRAITINPYLCQGMGSCATACPTEAITYALPESHHTQDYIFQLLTFYRQAKGQSPVILFYTDEDENELAKYASLLEGNVLPIKLEELACVGIDTWFSALVYGAAQVILLETSFIHEKTRQVLDRELEIAHSFLFNLQMPLETISFVPLRSLASFKFASHCNLCSENKLQGSKRDKLANALDLLSQKNQISFPVSSVPMGAPYGRIEIKSDGCTLCLSCVTVCPTQALEPIGTYPGITFKEQDCVQCGLCERACPESVISLSPRYNWDKQTRQTRETLHEEAAAECLSCGKPFAPVSLVNMLKEKLREHSHFKDDAIKRLSMCEDCRVRDIFTDFIEFPEKQLKL